MKEYIRLLRVKHYIKNILVFLPLFFGTALFDVQKLCNAFLGFICFCLLSSSIYIINDYRDMEKDRNHPTKKNRPLASGNVKPQEAFLALAVCLVGVVAISWYLRSLTGFICIALYFALNVAYSMGLKNIPIIDIVILASGFVIRVFYGGFISGIIVSTWLYLVVTTGSLYMGLGKRRNELKSSTETREVLKYYSVNFLDKNMYVCVALTNVFYALWTLEFANVGIGWTIPAFIIILMRYSLDIEGDSDGDPVEVILKDKILIAMIILYAVCIFSMLYIF
ncbi:MAG: decaprenyl-phosphate phosphoribosyltransferase [Lachnospiraceae bacterium]|nr:decaprenyl-phosphate phosphoribosyltransferase [Lachnospiraceae bacterium]